MSSEAITQNDLREILSRTVGSVPSEYKKLLWTNPNIDTDFAPQTILNSGQLNGYDEVEIWASFLGSNSPMYPTRVAIGTSSTLAYQNLNTTTASNASTFINGVARDVSVSTSGITFGNGQMTYSGNAYVNWQSRAIPYKVYGIKYERVEPPQLETPIIQTLTVTAQTDANGYFHPPTSLNDAIPIWAEVSGRPTGLRPCFLTNGYTETERYGLRFKAWNDVVAYTSTTITVTIYYIKLVN